MNADLLRALDRRLQIMRGFNEGELTVDGQLFQLCRDALAKQDQGSVVKESLTAEYICKCGMRVEPHRCQTLTEF